MLCGLFLCLLCSVLCAIYVLCGACVCVCVCVCVCFLQQQQFIVKPEVPASEEGSAIAQVKDGAINLLKKFVKKEDGMCVCALCVVREGIRGMFLCDAVEIA